MTETREYRKFQRITPKELEKIAIYVTTYKFKISDDVFFSIIDGLRCDPITGAVALKADKAPQNPDPFQIGSAHVIKKAASCLGIPQDYLTSFSLGFEGLAHRRLGALLSWIHYTSRTPLELAFSWNNVAGYADGRACRQKYLVG